MSNPFNFRVGNIVTLRNLTYPKSFYISRIVCAKEYDYHTHGVYLEDFFNPNNLHDYEYISKQDKSNDIAHRMSEIEGVAITAGWLIDNDFATLNIYGNETHDELFTFIKDCFGKYNMPDDYHAFIYTDRYCDDNGESFEVVILYNKDNHAAHIVSYTNKQILNSEEFCYDNNYKVSKTYTGKIYDIHELQNILADMEVNILDSIRK